VNMECLSIEKGLSERYTSKYNSSMLTHYHHVKDRFEYENYLDIFY